MKRGLLDLALCLALVRANGGNTQDMQRAAARLVPKLRKQDNIQGMAKQLSRSPRLYLWVDEMTYHYWAKEQEWLAYVARNSDKLQVATEPEPLKPVRFDKEYCYAITVDTGIAQAAGTP